MIHYFSFSVCWWLLFFSMNGVAAEQQQEKIVLAVGNNLGLQGEEPLRFAEQDAAKWASTMIELGGAQPDRVFTLQGKPASKLTQTIAEIKGRTAELKKQGRTIMLLFYYAGHGDTTTIHLGLDQLELTTLMSWLDDIPSDLRLVFLDSCQSVGASRQRGVSPSEAFSIELNTNPVTGTVLVSAASPGEPAQESDELGGAVFSHYLMSGLRGPADLDLDQQVTLHEAYAYAYSRTLLRTAGNRGGLQHPAFEDAIKGAGLIVLTRTRQASASLWFPKETDTRYLVYSLPSQSVLAEVSTRPDRETPLALASGRFLVQRCEPDHYGLVEVDLPWGGIRMLRPENFSPVDYQQFALRGGQISIRNWLMSANFQTELITNANRQWRNGGLLSLGYKYNRYLIELGLSINYSSYSLSRFVGSEIRLSLRPCFQWLYSGSWYTIKLGGGLSIEPTWQHLTNKEADRLKQVGLRYEEYHTTSGIGPLIVAGFSTSFFAFTAVQLQLTYSPLFIQSLGDNGMQLSVQHQIGLGFGISYAF